MTFNDIPIGEWFQWIPSSPEMVTPSACIRTGRKSYTCCWPNDTWIEGRVGRGDQEVLPTMELATTAAAVDPVAPRRQKGSTRV